MDSSAKRSVTFVKKIFLKEILMQSVVESPVIFPMWSYLNILAIRTRSMGHGRSYVPHLAFIFCILSEFIR